MKGLAILTQRNAPRTTLPTGKAGEGAQHRTGRHGFTLVEMMVAFSVTAVIAVALGGALIKVMQASRITETQDQAVSLLASVMEELRVIPSGELLSYEGAAAAGTGAALAVTVECTDSSGKAFALPVPGNPAGMTLEWPLQIQVTVEATTPDQLEFTLTASLMRIE